MEEKKPDIYTPSSIIAIFNNAFKIDEEKKIIYVQGVYLKTGSKSYGGFYYDKIIDSSKQILTIKISRNIRDLLKDKTEYTFKGHLLRRVRFEGYIELIFVSSFIDPPVKIKNRILNNKIQEFEVLKSKFNRKKRDISEIIKKKFEKNETPQIALICGYDSVVPKDFINALKETKNRFNISEHRINLSDQNEIVNTLNDVFINSSDIVAVIRGGGSGLEIFDDPEIAKATLNLKPILVTAIGHAESLSLIDMISDQSFDTPTAFGTALREIALSSKSSNLKKQKNIWMYIVNIFVGLIIGYILSRLLFF